MDSVKVATALRLLADAFELDQAPDPTPVPASAGTAPTQAAPSTGKKPGKPKPAPEKTPAPEPVAAQPDLRTQVADAVTALANGVEGEFTGSMDIAKGILKKYKVAKVSQLADKDLKDALADIHSEIATAKSENGGDSLI